MQDIDVVLIEEMRAAGLLSESEIEALTSGVNEVVEERVIETADLTEHTLHQLNMDIEREEVREAAYAEQESTVNVVEVVEEVTQPVVKPARKPRVAKAPKEPKEPKAPKSARAAGTTIQRISRLSDGSTMGAYAEKIVGHEIRLHHDAAFATPVKGLIDELPKKVGEKAVNLLEHIHKGKKLSVFTRLAVNTLKTDGAITSKGLVATFQHQEYSLGTARSQAQQMMQLLSRMGITVGGMGQQSLHNSSTLWTMLPA